MRQDDATRRDRYHGAQKKSAAAGERRTTLEAKVERRWKRDAPQTRGQKYVARAAEANPKESCK
jgi:hypothetical protein